MAAQMSLTDDKLIGPQLDITEPEHGVEVNASGGVLWVNVDGVCRLRVCRIPNLNIEINGRKIHATLPRNK